MPQIVYRLHTIERDGTEWTSPQASSMPEPCALDHVANVLALWRGHVLRWATEEHTGRFLYGYDAKGHEIARSPRSAQPCYLGPDAASATLVYHPAVRIYRPNHGLQLRAVRGMGSVALAYSGALCVGWCVAEDIGPGFPDIKLAMEAGYVGP